MGLLLLACSSADFERLGKDERRALRHRLVRSVGADDVLTIRVGELLRWSRGAERALATLDGRQPEILSLARDPAGPAFVLAVDGLYACAPESDVLVPVRLAEGAPPGTPTGIFVDDRRRVWITTSEAFGVVDAAFLWGRRIDPGEGLPEGPYRLAHGPPGEPVVQTPRGYYRYRPDRGPPPRITRLFVDGSPVEAGARLARAYGASVRLRATGEARGGPTFRWRIDGHHVWRPLEGETDIVRLLPGTRSIEVVAIDCDLNRSEPFGVSIEVAFPEASSPFVFGGLVAGAALLVAGLFVARAFGRGSRPRALARAALSTAILLALTLQILAGVFPHARGWPFIGFAMYSQPHFENETIYEAAVVGLGARGHPRFVPYRSTGAGTDSRWDVLRALIDGGDQAAESFVADFNARRSASPLTGVQVRARRVRLTAQGPVRIAPMILSHYRRPAGSLDAAVRTPEKDGGDG